MLACPFGEEGDACVALAAPCFAYAACCGDDVQHMEGVATQPHAGSVTVEEVGENAIHTRANRLHSGLRGMAAYQQCCLLSSSYGRLLQAYCLSILASWPHCHRAHSMPCLAIGLCRPMRNIIHRDGSLGAPPSPPSSSLLRTYP